MSCRCSRTAPQQSPDARASCTRDRFQGGVEVSPNLSCQAVQDPLGENRSSPDFLPRNPELNAYSIHQHGGAAAERRDRNGSVEVVPDTPLAEIRCLAATVIAESEIESQWRLDASEWNSHSSAVDPRVRAVRIVGGGRVYFVGGPLQ